MRDGLGGRYALSGWIVCLLAAFGARGETMTFDNDAVLRNLVVAGEVSIDAQKDRSGGPGGALRVGPGGRVAWRFAPEPRSATVALWVYEDAAAPADPKQHAAGAHWGLQAAGGAALTVGAIYAPYLSGATTYAAADYLPGTDERPWQKVQYLGGKRAPGWRRWTFTLDPEQGLSLASDDGQGGQVFRPPFNWNTTRLTGANEVVLVGDAAGAGQVLWVDDVSVEPGPPMGAQPLWPPPPPPELAVVPPPAAQTATPYAAWRNGPSQDPGYFPIAVWLQDPKNAAAYKAAGINLYIGLWNGPTEVQLAALKAAGMPVICDQNEVGLRLADETPIVAWMHGDEPDNAHPFKDYWREDIPRIQDAWPEIEAFKGLGPGKPYRGYGPPVPPRWIVRDYQAIRAKDPTRPVVLNLGQGVAWEAYIGRGERSRKLEDYPEYMKGCDIVSYDIYPATHDDGAVQGNLWYVAQGIARLRRWSAETPQAAQVVWNCIECTRISNPTIKPTPEQVRSEVWMSIIHGSRGLIYFVHQFKPSFVEAGLLADPEMLAAVTAVNQRVHALAPVINGPTDPAAVVVASSNPLVPVHAVAKHHAGATYLLSISMYQRETEATFTLRGVGNATAEVLDENRTVPVVGGVLRDAFAGHAVHLYRIPGTPQ